MKKLLKVLLTCLMIVGLTACGGGSSNGGSGSGSASTNEKKKVVVLLPFTGDQSYFDTLARGVETIKSTMSDTVDITLVEVGNTTESATWQQYFDEYAADGEYDLIVSGNSSYEAELWKACAKYPDQKFMNFDMSSLPSDTGKCPDNCYAVQYGLDDLGYVVGALSAAITKTGKVGVVVGMDNKAMNQFIGGWCQVLTDKGVQYMISYSYGTTPFGSPDIGKELANAQIENGCDVIWQVAGGTGNGVIEAGSTHDDVWIVGVDQDQYAQFAESNPDWAKTIITSALKNTDVVLEKSVQMLVDGTLDSKMGQIEVWGIKEGAVGLAENDYYHQNVSEDVRNGIQATLQDVADGKVEVVDTLTMDDYDTAWPAIRDANRIQ